MQIEGQVDEPGGDERLREKDFFLRRFPDGCERAALADVVCYRVAAVWICHSDFRSTPPTVIGFDADGLQRFLDARDAQ